MRVGKRHSIRARLCLPRAQCWRHGKSHFDYKVRANTDIRYKLVHNSAVIDTAVHYMNHFEDLLDETNTLREVSEGLCG